MESDNEQKKVGVLYADLDRSLLGTRSRIGDVMCGRSVLSRTVSRLANVKELDEIIVFCPAAQQDRMRELIPDGSVVVAGLKEAVPLSGRVRWRKWALASWRGGLHEATQFDEHVYTAEMVQYLRDRDVYTAVVVPSGAVMVDPQLIDGLIEHHHNHGDEMRFTFTQAGPGIAGCVFRLDLLHELVQAGAYIGDLLAYDPDGPHADFIVQECNYKVEPELYSTSLRYIADTQRSFQAMERLVEKAGSQLAGWSAKEIVAAMEQENKQVDELPSEVQIEINCRHSLRIKGYPHQAKDIDRGSMSLEQFQKIMEYLSIYDDICLTIGGFGEPLDHPDLIKMLADAKSAGIFGINIETDGRLLKGKLAKELLASQADTISVFLDANSREKYIEVKGRDCFDEVIGQLNSFIEKSGKTGPQIVPHLVKTRQTMIEMEEFYDRWLRACGCAVILGYNDFAGGIDDMSVMNMAPPKRFPCLRLSRCLTIPADGSITICGQDFKGQYCFGNVNDTSVKELWHSEAMEELRKMHREGQYEKHELCAKCKEWHR